MPRRVLFLLPAVVLVASLAVAVRGPEARAVVSGANGRIAFQSDRDGDAEIYSVKPDGTGLLQLTSNGVLDGDPAWSPDGTRIAYIEESTASPCATGACRNLWVMNADGSGATQLTNEGAWIQDSGPAWSPDGSTIAFASTRPSNGLKQVWTIPAAGGTPTQLTTATTGASWVPEWSPDGSTIVFTSDRAGSAALYTMGTSGANQVATTLSGTAPAALIGEPSWSPDGTRWAFRGSTNTFTDAAKLYVSQSDGSATAVRYDPAGQVYTPVWSPDGTEIAIGLDTGAADQFDVVIVDASTGAASTLVGTSANDLNPSWQPVAGSSPSPTATASPSPTVTPSPTVSASPTVSPTSSATGSASPSPSPDPPPPDGTHVAAVDDAFTPSVVDIVRGGTVVWDFSGPSHDHAVADATGMGLYASGTVAPGGPSIWHAFDAAGTYPFTCVLHGGMSGRVRVPVRAAPSRGSLTRTFTIAWAASPATVGFTYDVQLKTPGGRWQSWRTGVTARTGGFSPHAGRGTYRFRARLREPASGGRSLWSPAAAIRVG